MALSRRTSRSRFTLVLLVLTSITVLTLDFRGSSVIRELRGAAATVFSPFRSVADTVFGPVGNAWNGTFHYDDVRRENDVLRRQLDEARAQAAAGAQASKELDDLRRAGQLAVLSTIPNVSADVIAGPATNFEHTIELSKGSDVGIREGMPVVAGGLVGRVVQVTGGRSVVKLITDPDFAVAVRLATSGETAVGHGTGDGRPVRVDGVGPQPAVVVPDHEAVLTSGYDRAIFPKDIPVGLVTKVEATANQLGQSLTVEPVADLGHLSVVQVLLWEPPR
jgi:rod shape-determining protein MreC